MTQESLVPVNGFVWRMNCRSQFGIFARRSDDPTDFEVYPHLEPGKIYFDHVYKDEIEYLLRVEKERYGGLKGNSYATKRAEITEEMSGFFKKNADRIILSTEVIPALPEDIRQLLPVESTPFIDEKITHHYVDGAVIRECDDQFTHGGHDLVYPWLAPRAIITDSRIDKRDQPFSLSHEQVERILMASLTGKIKNPKLLYDICHGITIGVEEFLRREKGASYPGDANFNLKKEKLGKMILNLTL